MQKGSNDDNKPIYYTQYFYALRIKPIRDIYIVLFTMYPYCIYRFALTYCSEFSGFWFVFADSFYQPTNVLDIRWLVRKHESIQNIWICLCTTLFSVWFSVVCTLVFKLNITILTKTFHWIKHEHLSFHALNRGLSAY